MMDREGAVIMTNKNKIISLLSYLLILGALTLTACGSIGQQETPEVEEEPVDDFLPIISATGVLVPSQWATLSVETPGVIAEILVSEDEPVERGEVLLRLEGKEQLQANQTAAQAEWVAAQQALDELYKDPEVRVALAAEAVVAAQKMVEDAQRHLNNLGYATQTDIDQAQANVILARDKLEKAREDYEPYANKPEDNLIRAALLSKYAQAQKNYDAAARLLNNLTGTTKPLEIAEAEADLEVAEANLVKAERDYEILQSGPDPDIVAVAEARVSNARDQVTAADKALEVLEVRAPFNGIVGEINVRANEWIIPGQPVFLLADLSHMKVETTDLNEIDVAQIEVGDAVTVTFDALPDVVVSGFVSRIAVKPKAGTGVNYTVEVELEEIPDRLRWGMTAFVDITVEG
jgi:multidrug efflux pump subunit AcrA (membrane-fusion protein)